MPGDTLIAGLLEPAAYSHPTATIRLVETHSAWVVLTGEFAYKIKKPVSFGFLDFSSLEKRHACCEEEIRLNRRFAPDIYLEVTPIGGSVAHPRVGATGPVLEYAVRMRQFAAGGLLSELAEQRRLDVTHIDQLVDVVGRFHQAAAPAPDGSDYGSPDQIRHWVQENFQQLRAALEETVDIEQLARLQQWSDQEQTRIEPLLRRRRQDGFVRECHGDLHLGNITLIGSQVTPFDCIEFNPQLRWIDVISEIAFLYMDLDEHGYRPLARRFLNGYLQLTGDYAGLDVLRYYLVYRAMVRAKVAVLRRAQTAPGSKTFNRGTDQYREHTQLAMHYLETSTSAPALLITCGLSGSGKSTIARELCAHTGMIQLRSDVERKRLAGLAADASSHSPAGGGLYTAAQTGRTYQHLEQLAGQVLAAGYSVIVDATFLRRAQREQFRALAEARGLPFVILHCEAPDAELERRVQARAAAGSDASEAGLEILRAQYRSREAPDATEQPHTLSVDTLSVNTRAPDLTALAGRIDQLVAQQTARGTRD